MKKGLLSYSPPQVASLRIIIAALALAPYLFYKLKTFPWNKLKYILLFGFLEIGLPPFLYTYAQKQVDSSTAGILNSLVPIFTLILGMAIYKLKHHWLTIAGVFIGLSGAFLITFIKSGSGFNMEVTNPWGLLIVLATICYGFAGNILKEYLNDLSGVIIIGLSFVFMSIPVLLYLIFTNFFIGANFTSAHLLSISSIVILAVFGSALALTLFSKLIKLSNALYASFVTYLIPFVSILWGWLDGENISIIHLLSIIVIFFGIYVANKGDNIAIKDFKL